MFPNDLQEFQNAFTNFVIRDVEKSLKGDLEVGTIILVVIGIECLSGYYEGKESNRQTFVSFVNEFLPAYAPHADNIYACIRDGLAHDYIIKDIHGKSFRFTRDKGEAHLSPVESNREWFYINRENFANDFLLAQSIYFKRLQTNTDMQKNAIRRLRKRSFLSVFPRDTSKIMFSESSDDTNYPMVTGTFPPSNPKF